MIEENAVKILVDYLSFTIKFDDLKTVFSIDEHYDDLDLFYLIKTNFYLGNYPFIELNLKGGWKCGYNSSGISFGFGLRDDIYIEMSGTGCRSFETANPDYSWFEYITYIKRTFETVHFARIDIAGDTRGLLNIRTIQKHTNPDNPLLVTKFHNYGIIKMTNEMSAYYGSTKSDFRVRIYDKTLERLEQTKADISQIPKNWVRCELQMRNKPANAFIEQWLDCDNISTCYFGLLRGHINFVKKREINVSRSVTCKWWLEFLGYSDKIKLCYSGGIEYNLENLTKYVFGQAGRSIKTWLEINDYDLEKFKEKVNYKELNPKQSDLLNKCKLKKSEDRASENTQAILKILNEVK